MMSYELFRNILIGRIKDFLPEEYQDYQVKVGNMKKVNRIMDCMNLMPPEEDEDKIQAVPNIYINEMYDEFKKCMDLNYILRKTAAIIVYAMENMAPDIGDIEFTEKKGSLIFCLINTERNAALLADIPHREIMDLSVTYRFLLRARDGELGTVLLDNNIMEEIGLSEGELFQLAMKNTKRLFPARIRPLSDSFIVEEDGIPEGKPSAEVINNSIYFLTNSIGVNGAACILFEEELERLAGKMRSGFYIVPSSIHEVIAISELFGDIKMLTEMVREGNKDEVTKGEVLSDYVYHYDRETRRLSLAGVEDRAS